MLSLLRDASVTYLKSRALPPRAAAPKEQPPVYGSTAWYSAWQTDLERVRTLFTQLIGAQPHEILVAPNRSAALNALADTFPGPHPGKAHRLTVQRMVVSDIDIPELGYHWLTRYPRDCRVVPHLQHALADVVNQQELVITAHIHPADGREQDLRSLAQATHRQGSLMLVDASYSAGWHPLHANEDAFDILIADTQRWLLGGSGVTLVYLPTHMQTHFSPLHWALYGLLAPTEDAKFPHDGAILETLAPAPELVAAVRVGLEVIQKVGVEYINQHVLTLAGILQRKLQEVGLPAYQAAGEEASALVVVPHPNADQLVQDLEEQSILVDWHPGHFSVALSLATTESDIEALIVALARQNEAAPR